MDLTTVGPVSSAVRALCAGFNGFGLDQTEVRDVLQELGLQAAFDIATADFGGITPHADGLVLSEAIHQAWLKVDEHGTEAAAATALIFLAGAAEEDRSVPMPFVVDRPFYFFIQERLTGAVLFMGRVVDPGGD